MKAAETVAREWMQAHPDQIEAWLDGVKSIDGEPAAEVVVARTGG